MLTKAITKRIELAHEPGEWIEVRPLSWRDLQGSRDEHSQTAIKKALDLGSALNGLSEMAAAQKKDAEPTNPKIEDTYDVGYLLHRAIVDWSYGEPVTEEAVDSLDQTTVDVVLDDLLPKTSEADQKNGCSLSTSPLKGMAPSVEAG